ncbi:PilX N-terminal domain-containing pilus assembly protein [Deinococcus sp. QL22]|uniref:pilus assembly PilX family protein n=1 Tax=Deinococcus sp. QL22 TaxID=2939437 RepID=UPI0020177966|nr:pilus assembly PilX N-terminal domain-containing protein [Deinococcus sp. QL22]UQN05419.1 pilus assembly PilX N-terminal domain-containing protein [Deinococcus sp. QL22]
MNHRRTEGYVLITVMMLSAVIMIMVLITTQVSMGAMRSTRNEAQKSQAFYQAQSGVERAARNIRGLMGQRLPANIVNDQLAAQWLVTQLGTMSGQTAGAGRYQVQSGTALNGTQTMLVLTAQGYGPADGSTRRIQTSFAIKLLSETDPLHPMVGNAPAALTVTGNSSINGAAPVAGDNAVSLIRHNFTCPPSLAGANACTKSATDPDRYTLKYVGTVPQAFEVGKMVRPTQVAAGSTSEERYMVESINRQTGEVKLTVISDFIRLSNGSGTRRTFNASGNIEMQERADVPALLIPPDSSFSNVSSNVSSACTIYACERYTLSSNGLFNLVAGMSKADLEARFQLLNQAYPGMYNTTGTAVCTPPTQWLKLSSSMVNLRECPNPQMIIVDARGKSSIDIDLPTKASFRGLLYVLGDNNTNVKVASNVGFAGSVIIDNGQGGLDLRGTGNFNIDCADTQIEDGLKKNPKLCYDASIMAAVKTMYIDQVLTYRRLDMLVNGENWQEVGQ